MAALLSCRTIEQETAVEQHKQRHISLEDGSPLSKRGPEPASILIDKRITDTPEVEHAATA